MYEDDEDEGSALDTGRVLGQGGDSRPRLCARQCDTCVFRPGNVAGLRPGRLREMVRKSLTGGGFIPCHETIRRDDFQPAICRGFFDRHGHLSNLLRIWGRLGGYREVEPPGIKSGAERS
jgi:hypothetical protein